MTALTLPDDCHTRRLIDSARGVTRSGHSQQVLELRNDNTQTTTRCEYNTINRSISLSRLAHTGDGLNERRFSICPELLL